MYIYIYTVYASFIHWAVIHVRIYGFPVLSQIKPQAPLLVVPFRQFL